MQSTARLNADCHGIVMECFGFLDYDNMHKACRCDQSADGVRSSIMMAPDPTSWEGPCVVLILLMFDSHFKNQPIFHAKQKIINIRWIIKGREKVQTEM